MSNIDMTHERSYVTTHPWLTFTADLKKASAEFWMLLGEAQSKCEHIAGVPLQPSIADRLYTIYLAKGALATTAIEGNTLSEAEVLQHLEGKLQLPRSREYLAQEIDNVVAGCNSILERVKARTLLRLSGERIKQLNHVILDKLPLQEDVIPGQLRRHNVTVARYRGAAAEDCDYLLNRLCDWLSGPEFTAPHAGMLLAIAICKAILAHLYLAWIHPFGDGNGRTARLVEFEILISSGVPAPAAHLLSNHYNQTRAEYYRRLDMASKSGGDILPFMMYAIQGFTDGLKTQLQVIREQQWNVAWENFVHESFHQKSGVTHDRRKHLVLDLSRGNQIIPLTDLSKISPRVAAEYATKTRRTVARDVNALVTMGLLEKTKNGIRARKETILAFLPERASIDDVRPENEPEAETDN